MDPLFTDNPLISSMYHALGMGSILPENKAAVPNAAVPPAAAPPQVKAAPPGRSKPNIAPYRNRPYIARMINPMELRAGGRGGQPGGGSLDEAPLNPEDLHSPEAQALLGQFGVSNNVNIDPNLFMHNPEFNAAHPKISGALEGALSGLAFTQGGNTIGESLSNVARGMMESTAAHTQHINAQLMAPFQQAQTMATLQNEAGNMDERKANIAHMQAMSDYYKQMAQNHADENDLKQQALDQKKQYDDQIADLKEQISNPMNTMGHMYFDSAMRELQKQYPKGNIPSAALLKVIGQFNGLIEGQKNAWHAGAQSRANESLSLREKQQKIAIIKDQVGNAQKHLDGLLKIGNMYMDPNDPKGGILMPGTPEFQTQVGQYQDTVNKGTKMMNDLGGVNWTGNAPTGGGNTPPQGATIINSSDIK